MPTFPASMIPLLFLAPPADAWLGIYLDPEGDAAVVTECIPDSPAAKAGLAAGDVLLAVGDTATATRDDFTAAIHAHKPGDRVSIRIRRGDKEQNVVVKLGERPAATREKAPAAPATPQARHAVPSAPTAEVQPEVDAPSASPHAVAESAGSRGYLGLRVRATDAGVLVEGVIDGSPAKVAGIADGETITSFGDHRIASLADLDTCLRNTKAGESVSLTLRGHEGVRSVLVKLGRAGGKSDEKSSIEVAPLREGRDVPHTAEPRHDAGAPAPTNFDLEQELKSLRAELADLRRQLEALRRDGRE